MVWLTHGVSINAGVGRPFKNVVLTMTDASAEKRSIERWIHTSGSADGDRDYLPAYVRFDLEFR